MQLQLKCIHVVPLISSLGCWRPFMGETCAPEFVSFRRSLTNVNHHLLRTPVHRDDLLYGLHHRGVELTLVDTVICKHADQVNVRLVPVHVWRSAVWRATHGLCIPSQMYFLSFLPGYLCGIAMHALRG